MGRRVAHCVVTAGLLALAACSTGGTSEVDASPSATPPASSVTTPPPSDGTAGAYVALGDSYTAGPGIDPQQPDAGLCQRAAANWPSVVATALGVDLTDLSCSGATSADLVSTLDAGALPADAGTVTISAGGNDGGLFLSLLRACASSAATCDAFVRDEAPAILGRTTTDLTALLRAATSTAPAAEVALVGYPRLMPDTGTCDAVGIPAGAVAAVVSAETALDTALATAAEQANVTYVSLRAASAGHDACAGDQAWTNGRSPVAGDGIVFHPDARGMAAVGAVVADAIRRD